MCWHKKSLYIKGFVVFEMAFLARKLPENSKVEFLKPLNCAVLLYILTRRFYFNSPRGPVNCVFSKRTKFSRCFGKVSITQTSTKPFDILLLVSRAWSLKQLRKKMEMSRTSVYLPGTCGKQSSCNDNTSLKDCPSSLSRTNVHTALLANS